MTDTRTPEQRQRIMSAVRQRDTAPEIVLRKALYQAGIRGWRCHVGALPGRPDIVWHKLQVAVFVDGAFWHGHPSRHRPGRSGRYWDEKIARNMVRDRAVDDQLQTLGWAVVRIWDFELRRDGLLRAATRVVTVLRAQAEVHRAPGWLAAVRIA
jgi:DNA mismatch endonuclease, patch repair protein